MPQAVINPVMAAPPAPAVAKVNAPASARPPQETGNDTVPAQQGGFADALKRQLNGNGQAKEDQKDTKAQASTTDTVDPSSLPILPFAPPDLASLLPSLNLPLQASFLSQGTTGKAGSNLTDALAGTGKNSTLPSANGKPTPDLADLRADPGNTGTLAAAEFAAPGKLALDKLASAAIGLNGESAGSKSAAAEAPADTFQAALAASSAQQTAENARMADTVARQQAHVPSTTVATPMGAPGWSEDVGNKLVWMAGVDQHKADLVLNPPNMGRIEVSITVNNDQATANFVAASSEVRDALEQSLPKLREMFANAGISLGQANVSGESSPGQQSGQGERGRRYGGVDALAAIGTSAPTQQVLAGNGLVDTFV